MSISLMQKWLTPFLFLLVSACTLDTTRPCDPSLEQLVPAPGIFSEGSVMSTPDRGVSIESLTQPNSVCHVGYQHPGGGSAILNLYAFDDIDRAKTGFQHLSERASIINPEFDIHEQSPLLSSVAQHANDLSIACHARVSRKTCTVVARYGLRVYWFDISQPPVSEFIQDHLPQVIEAMESKMMSNGE